MQRVATKMQQNCEISVSLRIPTIGHFTDIFRTWERRKNIAKMSVSGVTEIVTLDSI